MHTYIAALLVTRPITHSSIGVDEYVGVADLRIVNVIDAPPNIPEAMMNLTAQPNIDAVFYYAYQCVLC